MKLGSNFLRAAVLGALFAGVSGAGGCSDHGSVYVYGGQTEQACTAICQRKARAEQELGCPGNANSLCYEECRVQGRDCSANLLGAVANCVSALDTSQYTCGANGEAQLSGSACSTETSAWSASCNAGSGGNGSGGDVNSSGGSSSGGSVGQGGSVGNGGSSPAGGSGGSNGSGGNNGSGGSPGAGGSLGEGGSPDTPGSCQGTPTPCVEIDPVDCGSPGCSLGGICYGDAADCSEFFEFDCEDQVGCSWDVDFEECYGTAAACDSLGDVNSCETQLDCGWEDACTGSPSPCALIFNEDICLAVPGCDYY